MPAQWVKTLDEKTGEVILSDDKTFNLSEISGTDWDQAKLDELAAKAQSLLDVIEPQANLPKDDPELTWTAKEFSDVYGGRRFLSGTNIINRSTLITFTWDGKILIPRVTTVV